MTDIQCKVELHDSVTLEPNTTVELILLYTNLNEDISHHIRSLSLTPTWDLDTTYQYDIDVEVDPGETVHLQQLEMMIPDGLGSLQGFQVCGLVRDSSAESAAYEHVTIDSILRARVNNAERFKARISEEIKEKHERSSVKMLVKDFLLSEISTDAACLVRVFQGL